MLLRDLTITPKFTEVNRRIAGFGLHSIARRFERGGDRTDAAVLADFSALAAGYAAAVAARGEFEITVPSGGRWIGAFGPGDAVVIVRTFIG